ncbi:pol polyprotein [Vairimorpha necatrix]|uniref:Pol polyprotein n=1 Tax=Vairimorpha necatrix TaxID=6039 RepID=A0AAX4JHM1_9MICR
MVVFILYLGYIFRNYQETRKNTELQYLNSKKNEIMECAELLFMDKPDFIYQDYSIKKDEEIARVIYNSLLTKLKFPIKVKVDEREEAINLEELEFTPYWHSLNENLDLNGYVGKEKMICELLYFLGEKTKRLYRGLLCLNFNVFTIDKSELENGISSYMNIKMEKETSHEVKKVFKTGYYKEIIKKILDGEDIRFNIKPTTESSPIMEFSKEKGITPYDNIIDLENN